MEKDDDNSDNQLGGIAKGKHDNNLAIDKTKWNLTQVITPWAQYTIIVSAIKYFDAKYANSSINI